MTTVNKGTLVILSVPLFNLLSFYSARMCAPCAQTWKSLGSVHLLLSTLNTTLTLIIPTNSTLLRGWGVGGGGVAEVTYGLPLQK